MFVFKSSTGLIFFFHYYWVVCTCHGVCGGLRATLESVLCFHLCMCSGYQTHSGRQDCTVQQQRHLSTEQSCPSSLIAFKSGSHHSGFQNSKGSIAHPQQQDTRQQVEVSQVCTHMWLGKQNVGTKWNPPQLKEGSCHMLRLGRPSKAWHWAKHTLHKRQKCDVICS